MSHIRLQSGVIGGLLAFASCVAPVSAQTATNVDGWVTLTTSHALEVFADVCGGSLPDFEHPDSKLVGLDFDQAETGTWFMRGRDASIKIKVVPDYGNVCSMTFGTVENMDKVVSAFAAAFPTMKRVEYGNISQFGDKKASVILHNPAVKKGDILYLHVEMLPKKRNLGGTKWQSS